MLVGLIVIDRQEQTFKEKAASSFAYVAYVGYVAFVMLFCFSFLFFSWFVIIILRCDFLEHELCRYDFNAH